MKLLSCVQPTQFLGIQHTQLITRKIPGHTAAILQPSHALCTLYLEIAWIWCDFCARADLLIQPPACSPHSLSPSTNMANSKGELLDTLVPIVSEELLLVNECSHHLAPYGLTLWVVSMNQMPKNCNLLNQFPRSMAWACHVEFGFSNFKIHLYVTILGPTYMVDLNLCTTRNTIIVHPRISIFISCFVVECPRISIYSASTPMSTTT